MAAGGKETDRGDCKVVLLGQHDVGKTSLVERFIHGKFKDGITATVGAAFGTKRVVIGNQSLNLGIWDTAGAERYESMSRIYYRGARAALVCFDTSNTATFAKARFWVNELTATAPDAAIYIVGCKADQGEQLALDESVAAYAQTVGAKVFCTSALTGWNVDQVFQTVAEDYLRLHVTNPSSQTTNVRATAVTSRSTCCS